MKFDPITGNEVQVRGFRLTIHAEDSLEDKIEQFKRLFDGVYKDEDSHKIVRLSHRFGAITFFANLGEEEQLQKDIVEYIKRVDKENPYPHVFDFHNFVSYSPLKVIKGAKDDE